MFGSGSGKRRFRNLRDAYIQALQHTRNSGTGLITGKSYTNPKMAFSGINTEIFTYKVHNNFTENTCSFHRRNLTLVAILDGYSWSPNNKPANTNLYH